MQEEKGKKQEFFVTKKFSTLGTGQFHPEIEGMVSDLTRGHLMVQGAAAGAQVGAGVGAENIQGNKSQRGLNASREIYARSLDYCFSQL